MAYSEENINKILREYDFKRAKSENIKNKRVTEIYEKFPRLLEIKNEINRLGFENTKKIMENPALAEKTNKDFSKKLEALIKEKKEILNENNIPENYEKPEYSCNLCKDTGYIGNEKCSCFKKRLIEIAYEDSNLGINFKNQCFENFSFDFYSDVKKDGISERENIREIYDVCVDFCKNFDTKRKSLLMIGKPGLGKTFLSNCIAGELLNSSKSVVYERATSLFTAYDDYRFGRAKEPFDTDRLYNSDLLIIDDLGTEFITGTGTTLLFDIINRRIDKNKKMIINTNFTMKEMTKTYSARITSRIYEYFMILHFKGEDIRIQKIKKGL